MPDTTYVERDVSEADVFDDHFIDSKRTFEQVKKTPRQVAGLYFYYELDELIDVARAIAFDFFDRPNLYDNIKDAHVVSDLARLHARYGYDEKLLSRDQRRKIYEGILRAGEHQFTGGRDALLLAAAKFSERVYNTGEDMLRVAVRDAARTFKAYLTTLPGTSLSWSVNTVLPELTDKTAYRILRDPGVRAVFGRSQSVAVEWPYQVDGKGDELVELAWPLCKSDGAALNRDRVNKLQCVALRGAEAIATVLDYNDQQDRDIELHLILKCYAWYSALVRAGRRPLFDGLDTTGNGNRGLIEISTLTPTVAKGELRYGESG